MAEVHRYGRLAEPNDIRYTTKIVRNYVVPASLSMIGCFMVMLTFIMFPKLRKIRYIEIMFYVSINNFIASLGGALGPVPNYSPACWFQGIVTSLNFVSAALWITVLTFQLWHVIIYNECVLNMFWTHVFVWTVPAIFALLPLTTNTYGNPNGYRGNEETSWCFIVTSTDDADPPVNRDAETDEQIRNEVMWDFFSFYLWICACIIVCVYLVATMIWKLRNGNSNRSGELAESVWKLFLYPGILVFCWLYTMVSDFMIATDENFKESEANVTLPLLSGMFLSVAFFYVNPVVRKSWMRLLSECRSDVRESGDAMRDSIRLSRPITERVFQSIKLVSGMYPSSNSGSTRLDPGDGVSACIDGEVPVAHRVNPMLALIVGATKMEDCQGDECGAGGAVEEELQLELPGMEDSEIDGTEVEEAASEVAVGV